MMASYIKKYKIKLDPKLNVWYVLSKFMDQNSRLRWEIKSTHKTKSDAKSRLEKLENSYGS